MYDLIYALTSYKKYGKKLGNYSKNVLLKTDFNGNTKEIFTKFNINTKEDFKNVLDLLGLKKITETDKAELYFKLFKLDLNNNTSIYYNNILKMV